MHYLLIAKLQKKCGSFIGLGLEVRDRQECRTILQYKNTRRGGDFYLSKNSFNLESICKHFLLLPLGLIVVTQYKTVVKFDLMELGGLMMIFLCPRVCRILKVVRYFAFKVKLNYLFPAGL